MRNLILTVLLVSGVYVSAAESLQFKDGSILNINDDGTMTMTDKDGKAIAMKDDMAMELEDGTLVMMKNKKVYRHDHRRTSSMMRGDFIVETDDGSSIMIKDDKVWRHDHLKYKK